MKAVGYNAITSQRCIQQRIANLKHTNDTQ